MTSRLLALSATSAVVIGSSANAAIISFNDAGLFAQFAAAQGAAVATEGFDSYSGFAASYDGVLAGVSWSASATSGMFAADGLMSTNNPETMFFDFAGGVNGVGGQFFATDINFNFVASTIMVGLADGSGFVGVVNSASQFQGFYSTGAAITSISVQVMGTGNLYPTADSLSVAVVPAPGAVALLAVAGLAGARRRR
jgi:MYXO-CTERM domain-containing protein